MGHELHPPVTAVRVAVQRALEEDLTPLGDVTSALLPADLRAHAQVVARAAGVLAGTACATEVFAQLDPAVTVAWEADDGAALAVDAVVARVSGPLRSVLTGERGALNFLGHLSGIATLTRRFVDAAAPLQVWDTRKTTPGLRALEKAAVRAGGGVNHRGNLSDWILLKDNHLAVFGIADAVKRARERWPARTVHVECDRIEQVREALDAGADALLLDNMTPAAVAACVAEVDVRAGRRPLLEVSGGITLANVGGYSQTGVDLVSIGALTNSAPVLDLGLDLEVSA